MKILMRNIGMTLHVIHKLRAQGLDNVKVNMDWQHLLMNGESLAEYAALLAAEGLLGHQHANSGWGTFDDDNMVGATAFMETLELAVELRRAGYGENGERLGFDLYPYTEDAVAAVKRSVLQWRFIDSVAARIDDAALREAQQRKGRGARLRARLRGARRDDRSRRPRRRHDRRQGARHHARRRRRLASAEERYAVDAAARLVGAGSRGLVARERGRARARSASSRPHRPLGPDARARLPRRARPRSSARRSSGTTSARRPSAEIEERVGLERLIALTGNRALTGFTAPKLLWLRDTSRRSTRASPRRAAQGLRRLRLTGEWAIDAADASGTLLFDVANRRWSDEVLAALEIPLEWLPPVSESTEIAGAGDQQAAALGVGVASTPARSPSSSGPRASSSPRSRLRPRRRARVHAFCHAVPAPGRRWA